MMKGCRARWRAAYTLAGGRTCGGENPTSRLTLQRRRDPPPRSCPARASHHDERQSPTLESRGGVDPGYALTRRSRHCYTAQIHTSTYGIAVTDGGRENEPPDALFLSTTAVTQCDAGTRRNTAALDLHPHSVRPATVGASGRAQQWAAG